MKKTTKLIKIAEDETILVSSRVEKYLKPDVIYLPVASEILKNKSDYVKMGEEVLKGVKSPVSGVITSLKKMNSLKKAIYYLEIENDFEERIVGNTGLKKKLSKEEIIKMLDIENKKNLVLNAIDDEIYVRTNNFYLFLHYDILLEFLDEIASIFSVENIYVCLKANSSENISNLLNDLGMYPNIILKVVPDLYLLGKKEFLLSYLQLEDEESLVISAKDFYDVYNLLKRGRTKNSILITISGNAVKKPCVIEVKIGMMVEDALKDIEYLKDDVIYIANGLLSGKKIDLDSFVITDELESILIMKKDDVYKEEACIRCTKCSEICPVNINPCLLKYPKYAKLVEHKCIKCGLCSYICPVHINFFKERSNL